MLLRVRFPWLFAMESNMNDNEEHLEYKGYTIFPIPMIGNGDVWYGGYEIAKRGITVRVRRKIFPGFFHFGAARTDSIEHAKLEIDQITS